MMRVIVEICIFIEKSENIEEKEQMMTGVKNFFQKMCDGIAIFIIYDRDNEDSKIFSSLTRCFRRFVVLVADIATENV